MSRISKTFSELRRRRRKALIPFLVAGSPDLKTTGRLVLALEQAGADIIELGIPFSDPMADGPVIQRASEAALRKGVTLQKILRLVRTIRKGSQTPIVLMGYFNPILSFDLKRFARAAAAAGVDGLLVVDLPPEESGELDRELKRRGIDLISLLAPTSDAARVRVVARRARGYIYYVSMTGITGARLRGSQQLHSKIALIRRSSSTPIVVGFGIQTPAQAGRIGRCADGVVIGSALVSAIARSRHPVQSVTTMVRRFRRAV